MKNFFYLFVALLFFSCSESDEAEPDSVKNYLISNIFKETGTYSIFTNNTYQELTATNFIDFKLLLVNSMFIILIMIYLTQIMQIVMRINQ